VGEGRQRLVFVIGPCGAGKSAALHRMRAVLGDRVGEIAVLETDTIYMMIDPTWSEYNERRATICRLITARTAAEFFRAGFNWVVVGSNGLQDREHVDTFLTEIPADVEAFHLFLDPSTSAVRSRITGRAHPIDAHKTPEWIETNVAWMRGYHNPDSARIDNSDLDIDQTVEAIYKAIIAGDGRIRR
jgi:RNase adaptor protein for sRNA GlmZ degradation